jgi:[ribosomal protein S5]-alanine N-acetyltransferase
MKIAETQRIMLRLFNLNDLDDLAAIFADPQVMHFSISGVKTKAQTKSTIENILLSYQKHGWGLYAIEQKEDRQLIGYCGLFAQQIDGQAEIEVGFRLANAYWGKGLATEATIVTRDDAFARLGITRLISIVDPENVRSIRVAEKIGMQYEKDTVFQSLPVRIYAIELKPD